MSPAEADADADAAVAQAFRQERAIVLATLIRQAGDLQLAEDAVQDAFEDALKTWRRDGVPANPGAWLTTTARRRAIDRLRRSGAQADRAQRLAELLRLDVDGDPVDSAVADDRLRLIFTCCHPALDLPARVALTLRLLGGLTTAELARAFVTTEPAIGKRISRAKRKLADAGIPYAIPPNAELPERVNGVLQVVYLIFNEGYAAASGDRLVRPELCDEAIRLGVLLGALLPDDAEVWGLVALMDLHDARRATREQFRLPSEQDHARWDQDRLATGLKALERSIRLRRPGEFGLQAAIAALQLADTPDWVQLADLYGALGRLNPSPVIELNRAVAVSYALENPQAGLDLLEPLHEPLADYQPLHATHADLLRRSGDAQAAKRAYERAIELSGNAVERSELERRKQALSR